jgi:hypothetical protein
VADVVTDERAGDAELHVGVDVGIVGHVDLGDERLESPACGS